MSKEEFYAQQAVGEALQVLRQHRILAVREMTEGERVLALTEEIRSIAILSRAITKGDRAAIERAVDDLERACAPFWPAPPREIPPGMEGFQK
jgi:hypothetical protein